MPDIPRQPITDEFLTELTEAFRMPLINPTMNEREIQFKAGGHKVLLYCIQKVTDYKKRHGLDPD